MWLSRASRRTWGWCPPWARSSLCRRTSQAQRLLCQSRVQDTRHNSVHAPMEQMKHPSPWPGHAQIGWHVDGGGSCGLYIYIHILTCTHTHIHTHTHICTHTHTHTHTHTLSLSHTHNNHHSQTDRLTDRQIDRQTDRLVDWQNFTYTRRHEQVHRHRHGHGHGRRHRHRHRLTLSNRTRMHQKCIQRTSRE